MSILRLLGPASLRDDSGAELHKLLGQPKRFAVLAYLAGNAPQVYHRRDRVLGLFWPESTTEQARHGLRQVLYELRNHLGEDVIVPRGVEEIALNEQLVTCDVAQFHAALAEGDLQRALELYRGPFLDALFVSAAPELMDWIDRRRAELHAEAVAAAWRLAEERQTEGDLSGAVATARRAVDWSPTDEVGVRRLIELLGEEGNTGGALRAYDRLARRLADEFEAEPSSETSALIASVREAGTGVEAGSARWLPEVRMSLGELYEERHDTANAIVNYAAFVELWKDADPQLQPRVDDVRRRLESLGSDPGGGS